MCGFVGYLGKDNLNIEEARSSINHRGSDMHGTVSNENWKIAFNRLSIHDLSEKGMQPFKLDEITVYMNGEIFNYIELIKEENFQPTSGSDVEIIPYLYKKYGLDFLNRLNGMFAIVLIDNKIEKSYFIRDRYGEKPLYYHLKEKTLYFASEVKAIKKMIDLEVDPINIQINFSSWFLPQPLTLYQDTFNIYPGCYLEFQNGKIEEKRWYTPNIEPSYDTEEEIEKKILDLYKSSIDIRLRSDVPVGVFLSGGLDSTSIAKFSSEIKNEFYSFSADIIGKEKFSNNTDVVIPRMLSEEFNFNQETSKLDFNFFNKNIIKIVSNYDEVFVNSGILVFYLLAEQSKKRGVSVILTGVGGDELFGGYPWQGYPRKIDRFFKIVKDKIPYTESIYKILININYKLAVGYKILTDYKVWHIQSLATVIFNFDFKSNRETVENRLREYANRYFKVSSIIIKSNDIYNVMNFGNIFTVLGAQNYLSDISTMRYSVENRSPFLDYRLFEYMMSIPDSVKTKYGQKGLLRKILSKHLPDYVTQAKKSGPTMPINLWFYEEPILSLLKRFIKKNKNALTHYLPIEFYEKIEQNDNWLYDKESKASNLRLFAIVNYIIWYKINISKDIKNENITFEELIRY